MTVEACMPVEASTLAARLSLLGRAIASRHLATPTMSPEGAARGLLRLRMAGDARGVWEDAVVRSNAPVAIDERADRHAMLGVEMKEQVNPLQCPC